MRVLGVDPGLRITGYGIVDADGGTFRLIEGGVLRPKTTLSLEARLAKGSLRARITEAKE